MENNTGILSLKNFAVGELLEEVLKVIAVELCTAEDDRLLRMDSVEDVFEDVRLAQFDVLGEPVGIGRATICMEKEEREEVIMGDR